MIKNIGYKKRVEECSASASVIHGPEPDLQLVRAGVGDAVCVEEAQLHVRDPSSIMHKAVSGAVWIVHLQQVTQKRVQEVCVTGDHQVVRDDTP